MKEYKKATKPHGVAFAYRLDEDSKWIIVEPGTWEYFITKKEKFDVETMRLELTKNVRRSTE